MIELYELFSGTTELDLIKLKEFTDLPSTLQELVRYKMFHKKEPPSPPSREIRFCKTCGEKMPKPKNMSCKRYNERYYCDVYCMPDSDLKWMIINKKNKDVNGRIIL